MIKKLQLFFLVFIFTISLDMNAQTFGNAIKLNGTSEYLTVPNGTNTIETSPFTFECWARRTSTLSVYGKDRIMMSINNGGWGVFIETNKVKLTKVGVSEATSTVTINDTLWHHIAVSHNGTVAKFYLDGVFNTQVNYSVTFSSTGAYSIGSRGTGEFFGGKLDDIRVWNVERSATEIASNYCLELTGNESGLKRYYKLNEGSGTVINDATPNAINGTVTVGGSIWVNSTVACGVGVNENSYSINWSFYPNPADEILFINANISGSEEYMVIDQLGKIVLTGSLQAGSNELDVKKLNRGMYFLCAKGKSTKFVKE